MLNPTWAILCSDHSTAEQSYFKVTSELFHWICYNSSSYVSNLFGETLLTIWRNQRTNTLYCSVQLESKEPAPFCQVSTNKSWLIRSLIQASYRSEKFRLTWRIDWLIDLGVFAVSAVFQPFNGGCCYQNMASLKFPWWPSRAYSSSKSRERPFVCQGVVSLTRGTI